MSLLSFIKRVFIGSDQPTLESSSGAEYDKFMEEISEKIKDAPRVNISLECRKEMLEGEQVDNGIIEGNLINNRDDE